MICPNVMICRDSGLLREALAEIYACEFVPLATARRARRMIGEIHRLTGISREQIIADVKADAECVA